MTGTVLISGELAARLGVPVRTVPAARRPAAPPGRRLAGAGAAGGRPGLRRPRPGDGARRPWATPEEPDPLGADAGRMVSLGRRALAGGGDPGSPEAEALVVERLGQDAGRRRQLADHLATFTDAGSSATGSCSASSTAGRRSSRRCRPSTGGSPRCALRAEAVSSRLLVHPPLPGPAEVVVGFSGPGSCCPPWQRPSVPGRSGGSTPSCDAEATAARARRPGGGR
jgi:hypothetical protein